MSFSLLNEYEYGFIPGVEGNSVLVALSHEIVLPAVILAAYIRLAVRCKRYYTRRARNVKHVYGLDGPFLV